jgi:biopolymer transport protein ExbD
MSCGQVHTGDSANVDNKRLTCLVLGYDSIIYYTGISRQMQDVHNGKITDTAFVSTLFERIKSGDLSMVLKPGGGADMLGNFQKMVDLANNHDVYRRSVDSGDINEEKAFGFITPPSVKSALRGEQQPPLKLNLPRNEPDKPDSLSGFPKSSRLVILLSGSEDIYAYTGGDMGKGKKYTYPEITDLLKERRSDKNFSVVIKAAENTTYKNTVDMLDVMTTADIKHYSLIDITKVEGDYLRKFYQ